MIEAQIAFVTPFDQPALAQGLQNGTAFFLRVAAADKTAFTEIGLKIREGFRQLPLLPGYAMTIHKAQGMTLDKAIIDRGNRGFFTHGQGYVAISRVRKLEDLFLTQPLRLSDVRVNSRLVRWEARFRDDRKLWADCVVNFVKQLSEDEKYYAHTLLKFQNAVMDKILGEYLRRFDEGESPTARDIIGCDLEAWCRVLFQNYTGMGNGDLTVPLDNIINLTK